MIFESTTTTLSAPGGVDAVTMDTDATLHERLNVECVWKHKPNKTHYYYYLKIGL